MLLYSLYVTHCGILGDITAALYYPFPKLSSCDCHRPATALAKKKNLGFDGG